MTLLIIPPSSLDHICETNNLSKDNCEGEPTALKVERRDHYQPWFCSSSWFFAISSWGIGYRFLLSFQTRSSTRVRS